MNILAALADTAISNWQNFYVIVGSSGGALIGLQFVVIALLANKDKPTDSEAIGAFGTPTVVHLAGALAISAIMSAPWSSPIGPAVLLALYALGCLSYCLFVFRRTHRQTQYKPLLEDWLWYTLAPSGAYFALIVGAFCMMFHVTIGLFAIGSAGLSLLFIGIRNAWDSVVHIAMTSGKPPERK